MITGYALAGIITGGLAVLFLALGMFSVYKHNRGNFYDDWELGIGIGFLFGIMAAVISAIMFIPYDMDYLVYEKVEGTVERVEDLRVQSTYVFTIDGVPYKSIDARSANVEVGDEISLNCAKEYEWGSDNHGYSCTWSK